ncbi:hypothetical protein H6F78_20085 [Coleofasciculus sp. FACHB-64]|uniref:hypothetical protein n=1 Tax=Cyanophyceae TaxID=3028117 RepID=UPI0016846154|nr:MULTISPECIES: hypothetical protein [unclassified Coleofasciculus]MBD1841291.1 hypothetical protein [Coleofasciculus sp. FACHB-501]MBD2047860.1 hypothetical protein [Coleofasciculus sp. FACHB-64]
MTHHGNHDDEIITGTADEHYNLISVLYHALEGASTYEIYIQDAEEAGDEELVEFFQQLEEEESQRAERAKELLAKRIAPQEAVAR